MTTKLSLICRILGDLFFREKGETQEDCRGANGVKRISKLVHSNDYTY